MRFENTGDAQGLAKAIAKTAVHCGRVLGVERRLPADEDTRSAYFTIEVFVPHVGQLRKLLTKQGRGQEAKDVWTL